MVSTKDSSWAFKDGVLTGTIKSVYQQDFINITFTVGNRFMKPEKVKELQEQFPNVDIPQIDCGEGWFNIIKEILDQVEFMNGNRVPHRIKINQIKSKFGGLRFYYQVNNITPDEMTEVKERAHLDGFVSGMEVMSRYICQYCGEFDEGKTKIKEWGCTKCVALHAVHES